MSEQQIQQILERLASLETSTRINWENHHKQSDIKWKMISDKLGKLDNLPCTNHINTIEKNERNIISLQKWLLGITIFVVVLQSANSEVCIAILQVLRKIF